MKTFARLDRDELIFITISSLNTLVTVALTIDRLIELDKNTPDYTFAIILLINAGKKHVLQGVFVHDSHGLQDFVQYAS